MTFSNTFSTILLALVLTATASHACSCKETPQDIICQNDFAGIVNLKSWRTMGTEIKWLFNVTTAWINNTLNGIPRTFTTESSSSLCGYELKKGTYFMSASFREIEPLGICNSVLEEWGSLNNGKRIKSMVDICSSHEKGYFPETKIEEDESHPLGKYQEEDVTPGVHLSQDQISVDEDGVQAENHIDQQSRDSHEPKTLTESPEDSTNAAMTFPDNFGYLILSLVVNMAFLTMVHK